MFKKCTKIILPIIVFGILIAAPVYAALPTILPDCARGTGIPPLSCFLELLVNVSSWILGISGSLALLYFIYGGFLLLTSRGSQEQVTKGRTILSRAIIGVIIIFGAYAGISFLAKALGFKAFTTQFKIIQPKTPTPEAVSCDCYCRRTETSATNIKIYKRETSSSAAECKKTCEGLKDNYWPNQKYERCDVKKTTPTTPTTPTKGCVCGIVMDNFTAGTLKLKGSSPDDVIKNACSGIYAKTKNYVYTCTYSNITDATQCNNLGTQISKSISVNVQAACGLKY